MVGIRVSVNVKEDANLEYIEELCGELPSYLERYLWSKLLPLANAIASEAKGYAPHKTGMLQASIVAIVEENGIAISCEVPYAKFQEFGTKYILPQMFMNSAMENHYEDIRNVIVECIHDFFRSVEA